VTLSRPGQKTKASFHPQFWGNLEGEFFTTSNQKSLWVGGLPLYVRIKFAKKMMHLKHFNFIYQNSIHAMNMILVALELNEQNKALKI
jgi:hypothetical protein